MALGEGGLDAQVEQRMDAYRGNPQQLQQRYGKNKELLDLLALQKLTSEKKQVAADMQLKAQQNPNTIAQQREQEALALVKGEMGGTLGELTGRTASTLGQKQKTSQQNMQRIAKGAGKPPAGIAGLPGLSGGQPARPPANPQAQGLAGARMAQAVAQGGPVRMAQGGIIGFAGDDGNNQVNSTPVSRGLKKMFTGDPELQEKRTLANRVAKKFSKYANLAGGFKVQSDAQREYAQDVMSYIRSLPGIMGSGGGFETTLPLDVLRELDAVNFDSALNATDLSALPVLPADDGDPSEPEPETETETEVNDGPPVGNVTFLPLEQEDFFKNVKTEYTPVQPETVDKSGLTTAIDKMTAQAGKVPTMDTVSDLEGAPLEFVEAPYDETGKEMLGELTTQFRTDAKGDPISSLDAARKSSDLYEGRADKAATYDQQEADLRALQSETLDPNRMEKLARMQTLAGGRFGSGGIGSEYVKAELAKDKRRNTGLEGIRSIQDTGISVDQVASGRGQVAGENAATRTENRRAAGLSGMRGLLADQETRALQGQDQQNKINIENKKYEVAVAKGNFAAARDALNREGAALVQVVKINSDDINNEVKRNISISEDANKAQSDELEALLGKAKARSDERLQINKDLFNSEVELLKLAEKRAETVANAVYAAMEDSPEANALRQKLIELAGSETEPEYKKAEAALKSLERLTIARLSTIFTSFRDSYADMISLNQRIQQIRAQNTSVQSTRTQLNPEEVTMSELGPQ